MPEGTNSLAICTAASAGRPSVTSTLKCAPCFLASMSTSTRTREKPWQRTVQLLVMKREPTSAIVLRARADVSAN